MAGKAEVLLKFGCGSRVWLRPGADAHVELDGSKITVHVAQGELIYKLSKSCPVALVGLDGAPVAATEAGTATLVKGAIVLGSIAAGAAGYGISQAVGNSPSSPPSVSPSR